MLEYLRSKGFELTITSLKCGHGFLTTSGNVSEHTTGNAVDIAVINGVPVPATRARGPSTDELINDVLQLQGTMHPHQVISLEDLPGETSFAMADHYDHVHVGYHPLAGSPLEAQFAALLKPDQWQRLIDRLGEIENPDVPVNPRSTRCPTSSQRRALRAGSGDSAAATAAERRESRPWPSSSDSSSSTSPAPCRWPTGATWRATRPDAEESVLVIETPGRAAAGPPGAGAGRAGRARAEPEAAAADPGHRDARLRALRRARTRRAAGSTRRLRGRGHRRRPRRRGHRAAEPRPARAGGRRRRPRTARARRRAGRGS